MHVDEGDFSDDLNLESAASAANSARSFKLSSKVEDSDRDEIPEELQTEENLDTDAESIPHEDAVDFVLRVAEEHLQRENDVVDQEADDKHSSSYSSNNDGNESVNEPDIEEEIEEEKEERNIPNMKVNISASSHVSEPIESKDAKVQPVDEIIEAMVACDATIAPPSHEEDTAAPIKSSGAESDASALTISSQLNEEKEDENLINRGNADLELGGTLDASSLMVSMSVFDISKVDKTSSSINLLGTDVTSTNESSEAQRSTPEPHEDADKESSQKNDKEHIQHPRSSSQTSEGVLKAKSLLDEDVAKSTSPNKVSKVSSTESIQEEIVSSADEGETEVKHTSEEESPLLNLS